MKGQSQDEGEKQKDRTAERMWKKEGGEVAGDTSRTAKDGQEKQKAGHLEGSRPQKAPYTHLQNKTKGVLGKISTAFKSSLLGWPRTFLNPFLRSSPNVS